MQHFKGMESLKLFNHVEECPLLSSISIIMFIDVYFDKLRQFRRLTGLMCKLQTNVYVCT